ncbi:hypothetical protein Glove_2g65 [Diversispora epigaea]|uniref:Uncharacterized protein n=1 Tax=Diversispora epigaea TaxID=1348612 RepID=A0A397JVW3_9GLOM|nr:hypothetical protein Glove_2g65 [Diversispora epigaea]
MIIQRLIIQRLFTIIHDYDFVLDYVFKVRLFANLYSRFLTLIAAMSDNTKLKPSLQYSSQLGCIIGSILSQEETKINAYSDIPKVIQLIKDKNGIANYVRVYILQVPLPKFPPVIIALIPNNGRDSADIIANLHKKLLLEIALQLNISIISIGSDGAAAEFKAQSIIMNMQTINKIEIIDSTLNINFSCPILSNIGPVIRIQDPKHAKKTARNIIMSGARVLTFGKYIANFEHFLNLVNSPTSVLYKNDVIKLDRQDDGAAYRSFCYHNLAQCLNKNEIKKGYEDFFIYLFVLGYIVDYNKGNLNNNIISNLTTWPSDLEITRTIRQSRQLACELAEYLNMLMPNSLLIGNLQLIILIETNNKPEVLSFLYNKNKESNDIESNNIENEINENCNIDLSQAITQASNEISNIQIIDELNFENNEDINKYRGQVSLINQNQNVSTFVSIVSNIEYVRNNSLDYNFLISERKNHDAYNSRPILRKLQTSNLRTSDDENSVLPNMASHIVSYFANNNNCEQNFVSQRENRWKFCHQSIAKSLADHNNEKSQQTYYGKRNTISLIPNIENANINDDFPLMKNHFVFCFYSEKICIGQVLALYFELYGNHSFNLKPVTKIDNISKITLKIFLPVNRYIVDYNKGNLNNNIISNLTTWPSDLEITRTIRQSRQLACELAEYLNMLMPNSLLIGNLQLIILIETNNKPEVLSFLYNKNKESNDIESNNIENEINENCNIDLSQAITQASNEISNIQIIDELNFENNEDINKYRGQVSLINQNQNVSTFVSIG